MKISPGRFVYHAFFRPIGAVKRSFHEGGPLEQWKTERGRREMVAAAAHLPPLILPSTASQPNFEVNILTGSKFWYQAAFCLHSLALHSGVALTAHVYDDGTLDDAGTDALQRLGLNVRIHSATTQLDWLDERLPLGDYPNLRERWCNYPIIKKLLATHLRPGGTAWRLIIDSDLLFFHRPDFLLSWLEAPNRVLHAVDVITCYGYSMQLLESLVGTPIPERVNAGLYGLNCGNLDWDRIEHWIAVLHRAEGRQYYLEQALLVMLVAGRERAVLPAENYVTFPSPPESTACKAVMHHYVADSKSSYFRNNWRRYLDATVDPRTSVHRPKNS